MRARVLARSYRERQGVARECLCRPPSPLPCSPVTHKKNASTNVFVFFFSVVVGEGGRRKKGNNRRHLLTHKR